MREIEFRVQVLDNSNQKYWIYIDLGKTIENPIATGFAHGNHVIKETVGQFTGLLDKNGKKIFEGDVVKFNNHNWKEEVYIATVVWGKKSHGYSLKVDTKLYNKWGRIKYYSLPCSKNIEIIGNITENPELLK